MKEGVIKNIHSIPITKSGGVIALDELLPQTGGSVFFLMRVAMIRAVEISCGSPPLIDHYADEKPTTIAFKEIATGRVTLKKRSSKPSVPEQRVSAEE